jgi:MFS family permease
VKTLLPWLVAVAFFMESLDTTILNTAVPSIATALHVAPLSMKVALTSYTLSLAVFIPVSGWMADRYGTRRVFATAIGIFSLGSFLCGVASSIHMLVAARILQGCGGSMMVPVGRLTLVRTFERRELVRVLSFVSIPALVGPLVGPLAGGLIVGYLHWSLIFFVNVPIGVISRGGQATPLRPWTWRRSNQTRRSRQGRPLARWILGNRYARRGTALHLAPLPRQLAGRATGARSDHLHFSR